MDAPLVSLLMTAYNREKYLSQAVNSILKSTYKNWELIILDDCSSDRTVEIAQSFQSKDKRIKVYINTENLGQFKNRDAIVKYANGKYLKFIDSDDLIYPYGLEQLVYYMENNPDADYGLCSLDQDDKKIFPILLNPTEAYKRHFIESKWIFHKAPLSSIIKTDVYNKCGGFPHEAVSGDFAMWCEMSQKHSVLLMPHGIVWYRNHAEQEMQKTRDSVFVEFEYFKVEEYYLKHPLCPLKKVDREIAIQNNRKKQNKYILWKLRQQGLRTALALRKLQTKEFNLNTPSV